MAGQGNQNDAASQARAMMKEMKATAEALTKDLGLPEERKFDVLSVIYGGAKVEQARAEVAGVTKQSGQVLGKEEDGKAQLYDLVTSFLERYMSGQRSVFDAIWPAVQPFSIEQLASNLEPALGGTGGMGFAPASRDTGTVISVMAWVLMQPGTISRKAIYDEAIRRGCPDGRSQLIAEYLNAELSNG